MIPIRKFLNFDKKELHNYLEEVEFFDDFFDIASPLGKKYKGEKSFDRKTTFWWDEISIGVVMPGEMGNNKRKILKKGATRISQLYIPITNETPRIELRVDTEFGSITIGSIEFMMTPPFLILGIYRGTGSTRESVERVKDIESIMNDVVF